MLCAVLVASGCSDDGSNAVESVTTTFPSTTAVPITASPSAFAVDGYETTARANTSTLPPANDPSQSTALPSPSTAPANGSSSLSSTDTATTTSTGLQLSEEEQIFTAIERYFEVLAEANDPPLPDSPLWNDVAAPNLVPDLRAEAGENLAAGIGVRRAEDRQSLVRAPSTILRQDAIAVVDVCLRDDLETYDLDTDTVIDDSVSFVWVQLTVTDQFGGWLVSQHRTIQRFDSEEPCVASYL